MNQPAAATSTVLERVASDILRDFWTNCFMKKSERPAIEIRARGGTLEIFSNPRPNLSMTMMNAIKAIDSKQ